MICKHCGAENREDYTYCLMCGKPLREREKQAGSGFKLDKKIIIIAAVAAAVVLALLLWPKGSGKSTFYQYATRPFLTNQDGTVYAMAAGRKSSEGNKMTTSSTAYSFHKDVLAFIGSSDDVRSLYVYNDKGFKKLADGVDSFVLAGNGDYAVYTSKEDGSVHHINTANGKDTMFITGEQSDYRSLQMSYDGSTVAFVTYDAEEAIKIMKNGKVTSYETGKVGTIVSVAPNDDVYFLTDMAVFCRLSKGKVTVIVEAVEDIFINNDRSEYALFGDDGFMLYRNGKLETSDDDQIHKIATLVYPLTTPVVSSKAYANHRYTYFYHYGLDSFVNQYYWTTDGYLIYVDKKLNVTTLAEGVNDCLASKKGDKVIYTDAFGNLFVCDSRDSDQLNTEGEPVRTLYDYDYVNGGVYYRSENSQIVYADKKGNTPFFKLGTGINMCCDDGWFYFKSGYRMYASRMGGEPVEFDQCYSTSKGTNEDYSRKYIVYYGNDKVYYYLKDGKQTAIQPGK